MSNLLTMLKRFVTDPVARFGYLNELGLYRRLSDEKFLRKRFVTILGYPLNLDDPKTFNEKLQWLKLYDRNPLYTRLVDKCEVKAYVAEQIGEQYVIPLVGGPWETVEEIDFDALPNRFVLKCTHDCGGQIVCRDKQKLDLAAAKAILRKSLKHNYYAVGREWPYRDVKPRIIAETYMEDSVTRELRDYKFLCFDGEPKVLYVSSECHRGKRDLRYDFFDMDYQHLDLRNGHQNAEVPPQKPKCMEEMRELARKLSAGIPHVRVDFYEVDGRVYFGEMTFYMTSGCVPFDPPKWDTVFGSWINLPQTKHFGDEETHH